MKKDLLRGKVENRIKDLGWDESLLYGLIYGLTFNDQKKMWN